MSNDNSEFILICWFGAQEKICIIIIINVENYITIFNIFVETVIQRKLKNCIYLKWKSFSLTMLLHLRLSLLF